MLFYLVRLFSQEKIVWKAAQNENETRPKCANDFFGDRKAIIIVLVEKSCLTFAFFGIISSESNSR